VDRRQVAVLNPLSREEAFLRRDLLTGLVRRAEHNWRHMTRVVRLFEIGHVFEAEGGRLEQAGGGSYRLPREENHVAAVISGARRPEHWSEPHPPDVDLFDLKGVLEAVVAAAAPEAVIEPAGAGWVVGDGTGVIGRALELDADRPAWAGRLYGFELTLREAAAERTPRYVPVPEWPAVERDVALVLPEGLAAATVEQALRRAAGVLLERLWVFDEYRGKPLAEGERSVAWRLVFRAEGRTLREEEADRALARAVNAAREELGVRRREA
jgi:phenylalanyl-tRNA synthetase beta chain